MALEILHDIGLVNPADYGPDHRWGTLRVTTTCDGSQGTCSFDLNNSSGIVGNYVTVKWGGATIFDGFLRQVRTVYTLDGKASVTTMGCQDDAVADASTPAAPFDLSDAPNGTTTFGYCDLTLERESLQTVPWSFGAVSGSVSTFHAGLAPTQLIRITKGVLDYDVRIIRLTTTWLNATTPLYTAEFATDEGTILPDLVQTIAARTSRAPWWRYVPLATAISVASSTTTSDTGVLTSAELTDLPAGCLGVQVRVTGRTNAPDPLTRVFAIDYDGDATGVVYAYCTGATDYYSSATGIVTTGGTNSRQMKYRALENASGTLTYSVTVVGYFTNIAASL